MSNQDNKTANLDLLNPRESYDIGYSIGYIQGRTDMLKQVQDELALDQLSRPVVIKVENKKLIKDE